jgi:hypothetical protein
MVTQLKRLLALACLVLLVGAWPSSGCYPPFAPNPPCTNGQVCLTTNMYDNNNSGWNNAESILNTTNVAGGNFGLIASSTALDEQVEGQPLVYGNEMYLVTANNTLYEINASTGHVDKTRNFGTAVPQSVSGCNNDSATIGIKSTPVIDSSTGTLYLVAYSYPASVPTYTIYGVDLLTLNDKITPHVIAVSATLQDSTSYTFNATVSRQRAALKLFGNNIYVAFSSFCDFNAGTTRGWIMSFNKTTLALNVANGYLVNQVKPDPLSGGPFYLTSIWQSGVGPAIDGSGNVYAATGNSHSVGGSTIYNQTLNLSESIVKWNSSLVVQDYLSAFNLTTLDPSDLDVGSGGIALLPTMAGGTHPNVLIQGGKSTPWRFIDVTNMGHYTGPSGPDADVANIAYLGAPGSWGCLCSPAYYTGSDNVLRVALPSPGQVTTYKLTTPGGVLTATLDKSMGAGNLPNSTDGFFTTVSSNGIVGGTDIVWAVTRVTGSISPTANGTAPTLFAFDGISGTQLFARQLANWQSINGNPNIIPVVNNGRVYVAGYKSFAIFGLSPVYQGPGDVVGGASFFGGLRAYTAAIATAGTQKLVNVKNSVSGETCDIIVATTGGIGNLANCTLGGGTGSAATYCTTNTCLIDEVYDQSGNGFHMTQSNNINMPSLTVKCGVLMQLPCMSFNGGVNFNTVGTNTFPNTPGVAHTVSVVADRGSLSANVFAEMFGTNLEQVYIHNSNAVGFIAGANVETPITVPGFHQLQFVFNSAASMITIDNQSPVTLNPGSGGGLQPPAQIGSFSNSGGANNFSGSITEVGVWNSVFNNTQVVNMCHNQWAYWGAGAQC